MKPLLRLAVAVSMATATIVSVQIAQSLPAFALGPGEVCVFNAPAAVDPIGLIGHTGWGYLIGGTNQWIYGATENQHGQRSIPPGHDIGYWDRQGTWQQMLSTFYDPRSVTVPSQPIGYYQTYKCYSTTTSAVGAANSARNVARCNGYDVFTNNSLDATYNILHAYNGSIPMPNPFGAAPNAWYYQLSNNIGWSHQPIVLPTADNYGHGSVTGSHC